MFEIPQSLRSFGMTGVAEEIPHYVRNGGDGAACKLLLSVRRRRYFPPFWRMAVIPNEVRNLIL